MNVVSGLTKRVFTTLFVLFCLLGIHNLLKTEVIQQEEELTLEDIDQKLNTHSSALTPPNSPQTFVYSSLNVQTIEVWNDSSGCFLEKPIQNPGGTTAIAITPKGDTIVAASLNGPINVWQKNESEFGKPLSLPNSNFWITALAITPDGKTVVAGSPQIANQPLKIWKNDGNRWIEIVTIPVEGSVNAIAITPDSKTIVIGEVVGELLDDDEGESHSQPIRILEKQPDGQFAVTHTLLNSEDVISIATTSDSSTIVAGGLHATLRSWKKQDEGEYSEPFLIIEEDLFNVKSLVISSENIVFIDHPNEPRPTTVGLPIS